MFSGYMLARSRKLRRLIEEANEYGGAFSREDVEWKRDWLSTGKSVLRALGNELGFDEFRVWNNKGGVGVPGETKLMGMWYAAKSGLYVEVFDSRPHYYGSWSAAVQGPVFMWRTIKSMKDYTGGTNMWLSHTEFDNPDELVTKLLAMGRKQVWL